MDELPGKLPGADRPRRPRPESRWREILRHRLFPWQHRRLFARRHRFGLDVTLVRDGSLVARVERPIPLTGGWELVERQTWAAGTLCEVAQRWAEQCADELAALRGLSGGSH